MSIITLTSDRKVEDFFLGRVKGQIMKDCPGAVIIDITHGIEPFNVTKTGFILKHSYKHFPEKTIHLIGVDSEKSSTQEHLLAEYENQYFICSDNGILGLIFETKPNKVVKINHSEGIPALLSFVEAAKKLSAGTPVEQLGKKFDNYKRKILSSPAFDLDFILGKVIYIDSYKNVITNITKELFENICKKRAFNIVVGSNRNIIKKINNTYQDSEVGILLAVFNSLGFLEIAMNKGQAARMFGITDKTNIRIDFFD